jgi:hypothetical protein
MRVRVNTASTNQVIVNTAATNQVVSVGVQGPGGPNTINTAQDVNLTDLRNGSLLVYSTQTQKWVSTTTLESQTMEGGFF